MKYIKREVFIRKMNLLLTRFTNFQSVCKSIKFSCGPFSYGNMKEEVYLSLSDEACSVKDCSSVKLNKSLYGLKKRKRCRYQNK